MLTLTLSEVEEGHSSKDSLRWRNLVRLSPDPFQHLKHWPCQNKYEADKKSKEINDDGQSLLESCRHSPLITPHNYCACWNYQCDHRFEGLQLLLYLNSGNCSQSTIVFWGGIIMHRFFFLWGCHEKTKRQAEDLMLSHSNNSAFISFSILMFKEEWKGVNCRCMGPTPNHDPPHVLVLNVGSTCQKGNRIATFMIVRHHLHTLQHLQIINHLQWRSCRTFSTKRFNPQVSSISWIRQAHDLEPLWWYLILSS